MSLTGNLEDLPLLDILQIVSFSKKTGYLSIRTAAGEGAIVFRTGLVVASFTWDSLPVDPRLRAVPPDKRAAVLRQRIELGLEQLIRLHEGQFNFSLSEFPPTIIGDRDIEDETLVDGINPQELLLELARGMDEDRRDSTAAIESSFAEAPAAVPVAAEPAAGEPAVAAEPLPELWLSPDEQADAPLPPPVPPRPAPAASPAPSDEDQPHTVRFNAPPLRAGTTPLAPPVPASPAPSAPPAAAAAPRPAAAANGGLRILLVDDEPEVRRILAEHFTNAGHEVVEAEDPDSAVKQAGKLGRSEAPFLVVTDLGMPTSGGSSFQGGFELVKRLGKMNLRPPVLLMADSLTGALQARARQLGIGRVVFKPSLSKLDPPQFEADLRAFARKLLGDVLPAMGVPAEGGARRKAAAAERPAPVAVPRPEPVTPSPLPLPAAAGGAVPHPRTVEQLSHELATLQRRLEDLRKGGDATQVSALVMEVAREFFERAILFLVKNGQIRGLGGFGRAPGEENLNLLARDVAVPLAEPSVFQEVVARRRPHWGALPDGKWSQYLIGRIGRFQSGQVALIPLLTHRETIAVLYGDNPETGRTPGQLESLEVFINQAGIALENAFLQRKLQALQGREVS